MNKYFIKVSSISMNISLAAPMKNANIIIKYANECESLGSKILLTPELSLTGSTCSDLFFQNILLENSIKALFHIANETCDLDILISVGLPMLIGGKLFNMMALIKGGDVLGLIPKMNLSQDDKRYFKDGSQTPETIIIEGNYIFINPYHILTCSSNNLVRIGFVVGDETKKLLPTTYKLASSGASIILNSAAYPDFVGDNSKRLESIKHITRNCSVGFISCSGGTGESTTNFVMSGEAYIAECGKILQNTKNSLITSELDLTKIATMQSKIDFSDIQDITPLNNFITFNGADIDLTYPIPQNPFIPEKNVNKRFEHIIDIQINALTGRLKHIKSKGAVVAVSGGLDSTLAILITYMALKKLDMQASSLIAVTMPCFGTSSRTKNNAIKLMEGLNTTIFDIPIENAIKLHFADINHNIEDKDVVFENSQARERSQIALSLSNKYSSLFVGTGDLSELALGFSTFAGDHISLYSINAGIPKTLIWHIVKYISNLEEFENIKDILQDILDTPISPELLPSKDNEFNQSTEKIIGPYKLHDFFIYHFVGFGANPEKILYMAKYVFKDEFDEPTIKKWLNIFIKRFFISQFKRSCAPDGPKIGFISLSPRGDLIMPSDAISSEFILED